MTTLLTLHTKATPDANRFETFWTTGRKQGVIATTLGTDIAEDGAIVAELSAMHYLLSHKDICGSDRAGNGMEITVTYGAIRKIAQGNTAKRHLFAHGRFLAARYAEAKITVSKDDAWISSARAENRREALFINEPLPETLEIAGFGKVGVSYHLIERMMQRANYASIAAAWHHLRRMLTSGQIREVPLPADVAQHKADKHGDTGIHLRVLSEPWRFVISQGRKHLKDAFPMIVTAYVRA